MKRKGNEKKPLSSQLSLRRRINFLKKVPLFAKLENDDLAKLANDFSLKSFPKDETIFRQDDNSTELYIVMSGKVRIFRVTPSGGETSINIFSVYDPIGEFAAIDSRPRSASAKTIVKSDLLVMPQKQFYKHMEEIPKLSLAISELLVNKLRWTAAYAETVSQYDASGRLLHILLLYNEQYGERQDDGSYVLDLSLNQTDLASLVGTRREWVNYLLREWRVRGLIDYERGKIMFLDLDRIKLERDSRIEANVTKW